MNKNIFVFLQLHPDIDINPGVTSADPFILTRTTVLIYYTAALEQVLRMKTWNPPCFFFFSPSSLLSSSLRCLLSSSPRLSSQSFFRSNICNKMMLRLVTTDFTRSVGWGTMNVQRERRERSYLGLYHIAGDIPGPGDIQQVEVDTGPDILQ